MAASGWLLPGLTVRSTVSAFQSPAFQSQPSPRPPPTLLLTNWTSTAPPENIFPLYVCCVPPEHRRLPVAAVGHLLVLRGTVGLITSRQPEQIHFGTVAGEHFKESALVSLAPPVVGAIPVLTSNGNLLLIDKTSGSMVVVNPKTKSGSVLQPADPHPVQAAAVDSDFLYLLSTGAVLKTDLVGKVLSTYQFRFGSGFRPASLGATGHALYLIDRAGRAERFQIQ